MFTIPVSRKVVATFAISLILAGLRKLGVYEASAEVTALIVSGVGLGTGILITDGTRYINYFLERHHLPFHIKDEA